MAAEVSKGDAPLKTVVALINSALEPMGSLILHLRNESKFITAVTNLNLNEETKAKLTMNKEIETFYNAMTSFQTKLMDIGGEPALGAAVPATIDEFKATKTMGGTRKHQAKKRASTRGSYRRQRY